MVEQTTVWVDSEGNFHRTEQMAKQAEKEYSSKKELNDLSNILKTASVHLKIRGFPTTVEEVAKVVRQAYPSLVRYYGD